MAAPVGAFVDAKDFVGGSVHSLIDSDPKNRQLLREAFPVSYAGRDFFRFDAKQRFRDDLTTYVTYIFTKFRGYFIGETVIAPSSEEVDKSVTFLNNLVFGEDRQLSGCTMGPSEMPSGLIGGIISSTPAVPFSGRAMRIRISQQLSQTLIVRKVQPEYPRSARQNRIQGSVVLNAEIDAKGNVQGVTLVSGDPTLATAAIEAVKQWKYKPYLLSGQPVSMDTQVTVIFTL